MMRTEAPKDLAGRGLVNFARTTPELPAEQQSAKPIPYAVSSSLVPTMWPCHLAPDNADLGAAHLLLALIDIGNPLAEVEAVSFVNHHPSACRRLATKRTWHQWCHQRPRS
jgi:hypothetical protein